MRASATQAPERGALAGGSGCERKCDGERNAVDALCEVRRASHTHSRINESAPMPERERELLRQHRCSSRTVDAVSGRIGFAHAPCRLEACRDASRSSLSIRYCIDSKPFAKTMSSGSPATSTWIVSSQ